MTPIIGGKADGQQSPCKVPVMELDGENYLLVRFKEDGKELFFYQLAGMVPAEVQATYRERHVKKGS